MLHPHTWQYHVVQSDMFILAVVLLVCVEINSSKRNLSQDLEKYVAASTEDLARLFQLEKEMWLHISFFPNGPNQKETINLIQVILSTWQNNV